MKRAILLVMLAASLLISGCGNEVEEVDTPAGHPDELRDSTRLDPARDTSDTSKSPAGSSERTGRKYRFGN
ncbi:MAG: hypothetical protein NDJ18_03090 [candidate division Zixibacteria bacterium]|nr:hypothetical protein [candidate division Zixibacteria bacterium]